MIGDEGACLGRAWGVIGAMAEAHVMTILIWSSPVERALPVESLACMIIEWRWPALPSRSAGPKAMQRAAFVLTKNEKAACRARRGARWERGGPTDGVRERERDRLRDALSRRASYAPC